MKLNDIKHNHSLTDLLKILIFAILMMIPFIDVGVRCLYVICNKNAYQSYYGETINEETETRIDSLSNLVQGQEYRLISYVPNETLNLGGSGNRITFSQINVISNTSTLDLSNSKSVGFYGLPNAINYYFYDSEGISIGNFSSSSYTFILDIIYEGNNLAQTNNVVEKTPSLFKVDYNKYSYLDNVFDYSVNKLTTSELYTWTQQTAIFTGVQTMTTQLGINNTVIPILLVYWFILSVIYIIIDIILKLFTILTHAIGSKTA